MSTTIAQATTPANGASNAADFQPETRNPQTAPGQLFSQPQGVQSGTQSDLLENSQTSIQVPSSNPAPATDTVQADASAVWWPWLLVGLALAAMVVILWRRRQTPVTVTEELPEIAVPEMLTAEEPKPKPTPSKPKKPASKKSKSQRKKRARR